MFFLSITKSKVSDKMRSTEVQEFCIGSLIFTVITDNFMSKLLLNEDGFSIVESPMIDKSGFGDVIFSHVIFNKIQGLLEVARSTVSGRTIYYHQNKHGDFFCSTDISTLREAGVMIEENGKVLPEFFVYRYVMPPYTLYKDILQLPSGSKLVVKVDRGRLEIRPALFTQQQMEVSSKSESTENFSARITDKLNHTCNRLKPVDGSILFLLSGGLDSSILCKICQKHFDVNTTYSAGYPFEKPGDSMEKSYAFSAAKDFGVRHQYYEPSVDDFLFGILEAIDAAQVPLHHLQSVLFYLLFRNNFNDDKSIVISGLGADGIFGCGFHQRLFDRIGTAKAGKYRSLSQYSFIRSLKALSRITGRMKGLVGRLYWQMAQGVPLGDADHVIWQLGSYGDAKWVQSYFGVSHKDIISNRYNGIKQFERQSIYDVVSMLCLLGSASVTQDIWSKLAEAHHKVVYYPFTDVELIKEAFAIPWELKLAQPKNILRRVGRRLSIPDHIVSRSKSSWGACVERWGAKGGVFEAMIPLMAKAFDEKQIRFMQSSQEHKAMTFWNILNYSIWKRLCIDNEPLGKLKGELAEAISAGKTENKWFIDSKLKQTSFVSKSAV